MKITEDHLEEAFGKLEYYATKRAKSSKERQAIIFAASSMKDILLVVLRAKSGKDLALSRALGEYFADILKKQDGDLLSFKYECGHNIDPTIIDSTIVSLKIYTEWKNDNKGLCAECWMRKRKVGRLGGKKNKNNRNKRKARLRKGPVIHFKNHRTEKTLCGHSYKIPGRSYSRVTSDVDGVTCSGCQNTISISRWIKKMVSEKKAKLDKKGDKNET